MKRQNRRGAAVLLMGAALSAAPMGLATLVSPAIGNAACGVGQVNRDGECVDGPTAVASTIDPDLSPAENVLRLQNLPPMEWGATPGLGSSPLVQTSLVDDVPVNFALPGLGIGVNLWPDLTPIVEAVTGAVSTPVAAALPAPAAPSLPPPPELPPLPAPPGLPPPPWPLG